MEESFLVNIDEKIENIKKLIEYVKRIKGMYQGIRIHDEYLNNCDYSELIKKLEYVINKYSKIKGEFSNYNEQYKKYISEKYDNLFEINTEYEINILDRRSLEICRSNLELINSCIDINLDELFDKFKYGDKNYIIFGKNGAGKSSLALKISNDIFNGNTFVIPAYRNIQTNYNYSISNYELNENGLNNIFMSNTAIMLLILKLLNKDTVEYHNESDFCEPTPFDKFKNIFENLSIDRNINLQENQVGHLFLSNLEKDISNYDLTDASDGERDIVFFILSILLLPQKAFLFIDEPENHLNGQLMINLFDELEKVRTDIKFVYLTHNIHFIESRSNVELIYLEKTQKKDNWNYRQMSEFKEISTDILLSIEGTDKDVIFCEGNDKSSFDYQILREVYDNFLIYPLSSCEDVINNVKVCNDNIAKLRRKSYGLVDRDSRNQDEISDLRKKDIYVYEFSEIENLLLNEEIVKWLFDKLGNGEEKFKGAVDRVCKSVQSKQSQIINEYITKIYYRMVKSNKLNYDDLEKSLNKINNSNKTEIMKLADEFKNNIEQSLNTQDYSKLVKIIPGKMIIKDVCQAGGLTDKFAYLDLFVKEIKINKEFKEKVKALLPDIKNI